MIQFLNAATGTASTAEMLLSFLPMILIIVFMIVLIYLPQKRQDKKDAAMRSSIEIGDKVTTIGGIVGIVCAIICPYLYPLRDKPDTYLVPGKAAPDTLPEGYKNSTEYGMDLALKRVAQHKGIGEFFASGAKNACSMWFGVLPTVMAVGTVALILANHTPIFAWLGLPFKPLLELLGVPEAGAVASTMIVGFTDMLTPAILIAECASDMARFIVAVVSVTQVLYLSEVGGLILGSKLPLNVWELFVIFLERTIISLLIVCPIAHLMF